jgi:hypothetical protein
MGEFNDSGKWRKGQFSYRKGRIAAETGKFGEDQRGIFLTAAPRYAEADSFLRLFSGGG